MKNKEAKSVFSSLNDFSTVPPPELWDAIEAKLEKPKKKKRAIIWWSVAASLLIGLSVPAILFFSSNNGNSSGFDHENGIVLQKDNDTKINESDGVNSNNKNSINSINKQENEIIFNEKENGISLDENNAVVSNSKTEKIILEKGTNKQNKQTSAAKTDRPNSDAIVGHKKETVALNNSKVIAKNSASIQKNNSKEDVIAFPNTINNGVALTSKPNSSESANFSKRNSESIENPKSNVTTLNSNQSKVYNEKAIVQNTKSKDSLAVIQKEVAQLEKALAERDKKDETKKKTDADVIDKWSLQVFAGVMSSENYTNEKALGNTVASKQSSGYGLKTNYKLNKKWAVSSGFKINELGQKIDGVSYYERGNTQGMMSGLLPMGSSSDPQSSVVTNNIVLVSTNENYLFASNAKAATGFETGNVTQNLKYFEMPFEISYALLSKNKTNITMNSGGFVGKLISNEMLLNGSSIGENKNVNEFVYGTVLSSTLQYEFYKKTKFFIEPGMNYYINPLESQSFNQFQWMFNVGLNFAF